MTELRSESFQVPVGTHGHYVVEGPDSDEPLPLIVGFHGYAENAEGHLEALRRIAPRGWRLCGVQGLHAFYNRKSGEVVASWMTRLNRELAIADNVAYVERVVAAVKQTHATREPLVYVGFSQGVAMAYRAAAGAGHRCRAVVALGGDVPPDVAATDLSRFPRVLVGRGAEDPWYTEEKLAADLAVLQGKGVEVEVCRFEGGHEWGDAFVARARSFVEAL
jgi:predicted esterase